MIQPKAAFLLFAGLVSTALASVNTTQEFYVRSKVISGADRFDGLYVSPYHTGAGMNDLAFGSKTIAKAFLNETQLQWDLGTPGTPWGVYLTSASTYVSWETATADTGFGTAGFFLDGQGSIKTSYEEWSGWIACDWWHGVPQLFYQYTGIKHPLPDSCAVVSLVPEYI